MKLIILAAGKGTRLGDLTYNTPKTLMDLGKGKTLLETQLENVWQSKVIDEVVIVVGYHGEQIETKMKLYQKQGKKIKIIFNPFYEFSNNLLSLWLAKSEMGGPFIVTNGDNIFTPSVFSNLVKNNKEGIFLTIAKSKKMLYLDDMKVIIDKGIKQVSKKIDLAEADGESVGLTLIQGKKYESIFRDNLELLARDPEYLNKFWLEVFNKMAEKGIHIQPFEINGEKEWIEVDFHGDIQEAIKALLEKELELIKNTLK